MTILLINIRKYWRQVDAWLWDEFGFGFYELGNLVTNFLIEVTQ